MNLRDPCKKCLVRPKCSEQCNYKSDYINRKNILLEMLEKSLEFLKYSPFHVGGLVLFVIEMGFVALMFSLGIGVFLMIIDMILKGGVI
jgi:hypothetical protein